MHDTDDLAQSPNWDCLFRHAQEQHGHFTASQAANCGYSRPLLTHHVRTGQFIRVRSGVYRVRDFPSSNWDEAVAAWLAAGKEHAVLSHETALDLLDLADVIPDAVHLTLPRSRRWYRAPKGVKVHTTASPPSGNEVVTREGMRVTAPVRTIMDSAEAGVAPEQVEMAVQAARRRGLVTDRELLAAAERRAGRVMNLVHSAIQNRRPTH